MNKYELAIVVTAKIEDEQRAEVVEKCKALIERFGGVVTNVDDWGQEASCLRSSEDEGSLLLLHQLRC